MLATARSLPSCGHWTTRTRCSSSMCIACSRSGRSRRGCRFLRPGRRVGVRRARSGRPSTASRWKNWSAGSVRTTGPVAFCVTARAARCRSILRTGGSGWDGEEAAARCWHLVVRREVGAPKRIKYSLSNAPAETSLECLAQMQGQRYWVERAFEDAKGECGLADYQVLGWRAWHHHVTMVMLAMLFIAEQRVAHQLGLALLTPRDIVEMLKETLPRKPQGREALVAQINQRHARRRSAIQSRYRSQRRPAPT